MKAYSETTVLFLSLEEDLGPVSHWKLGKSVWIKNHDGRAGKYVSWLIAATVLPFFLMFSALSLRIYFSILKNYPNGYPDLPAMPSNKWEVWRWTVCRDDWKEGKGWFATGDPLSTLSNMLGSVPCWQCPNHWAASALAAQLLALYQLHSVLTVARRVLMPKSQLVTPCLNPSVAFCCT